MVNAKNDVGLLCGFIKLAGHCGTGSKGFISNDVQAGRDCLQDKFTSGMRWRRYGDGIDISGIYHGRQTIVDGDIWQIGPHPANGLRRSRDNAC